MTASH
jgi:hypothetical protein